MAGFRGYNNAVIVAFHFSYAPDLRKRVGGFSLFDHIGNPAATEIIVIYRVSSPSVFNAAARFQCP